MDPEFDIEEFVNTFDVTADDAEIANPFPEIEYNYESLKLQADVNIKEQTKQGGANEDLEYWVPMRSNQSNISEFQRIYTLSEVFSDYYKQDDLDVIQNSISDHIIRPFLNQGYALLGLTADDIRIAVLQSPLCGDPTVACGGYAFCCDNTGDGLKLIALLVGTIQIENWQEYDQQDKQDNITYGTAVLEYMLSIETPLFGNAESRCQSLFNPPDGTELNLNALRPKQRIWANVAQQFNQAKSITTHCPKKLKDYEKYNNAPQELSWMPMAGDEPLLKDVILGDSDMENLYAYSPMDEGDISFSTADDALHDQEMGDFDMFVDPKGYTASKKRQREEEFTESEQESQSSREASNEMGETHGADTEDSSSSSLSTPAPPPTPPAPFYKTGYGLKAVKNIPHMTNSDQTKVASYYVLPLGISSENQNDKEYMQNLLEEYLKEGKVDGALYNAFNELNNVWGPAPIGNEQKRNELRTKGMQNIVFLCNDDGIRKWKDNYENYKIDLSEEIIGYPTFGYSSDPIRTGLSRTSPSLRENGIVYLPLGGIFANEPSPGEVPNVEYSWASQITKKMMEQTISGTNFQKNMQNLEFIKAPRMELVATQDILKNQEILWSTC